jgi:glycerophosphoryl diester phosphodiesterase
MEIIFHRINTLAKLSSVWHQTETVEIDVSLVDGRLAVVHPKDYEMDMADLEQLSWKNLREHNSHIPLLSEYLAEATRAGIGMFIETKGSTSEIAKQVAQGILEAVMAAHYPTSKVILHGFSIEAMLHAQSIMKKVGTTLPIGLGWTSSQTHAQAQSATATALSHVEAISGFSMAQIQALNAHDWNLQGVAVCAHYGFTALCVHKSTITKELTTAAHDAGIKVFAFVAEKPGELSYLQRLGTDTIICEPNTFYGNI